jgi:hypothetical protein
MPVLRNFYPNPDVPYYVPCLTPQIYETLRYQGLSCTVSLLVNLQFKGLLTYVASQDLKTAWMDSTPTPGLLGYPPDFSFYFDLQYKTMVYRTLTEGLRAISRLISKGHPVIASGSIYYLPYTNDYQNPAYLDNYPHPIFGVADHWLTVVGITEEKVLVFDPVPNKFLGPISHDDFAGFWRGNRGIPQLQNVPGIDRLQSYSAFQVSPRKKLNSLRIKELHLTTLKTITAEFLRGTILKNGDRTYFFGQQATLQLKDGFLRAVRGESAPMAPAAFAKCFMDLRFPGYFFRDLLADAVQLYQLSKAHLDRCQGNVERWEILGVFIAKIAGAGQVNEKNITKALTLMDEAIQSENEFHEILFEELERLMPGKMLPSKKNETPLF